MNNCDIFSSLLLLNFMVCYLASCEVRTVLRHDSKPTI